MSAVRKLITVKHTISDVIENGDCYAMSMDTLMSEFNVKLPFIMLVSQAKGYNIFRYQGVTYVGTKENRENYYRDKMLGQNPFYQTY